MRRYFSFLVATASLLGSTIGYLPQAAAGPPRGSGGRQGRSTSVPPSTMQKQPALVQTQGAGSSPATMKRPAVEPSAGAPVTFPGTQSNPTQRQGSGQTVPPTTIQKQPVSGQDQPPKSRDLIGRDPHVMLVPHPNQQYVSGQVPSTTIQKQPYLMSTPVAGQTTGQKQPAPPTTIEKQPFSPISYGAGGPPPTVKKTAMEPSAGDPVTFPPASKPVPDATHQKREMADHDRPVYYHPENSSATTVKKPAVEPWAGEPVTFSNKPVSDPKLHAGSSQDQPLKSRDIIGGGSTHQGGVAGHDGKLPIVGEAKLPTADEQREQPKGPAWPKGDLGIPTVGLDTFSRDATIGKLRDPASPLADGTGFKGEKDLSGALSGANRPGIDDLGGKGGRKTIGETMDGVNQTPHNGDGKNGTSKTGQQSEETNEYGGKSHFATVGNTVAIVKDDAAGVTRETKVINMGTDRERTTHYDPSGKQEGGAITRDGKGKIVYDAEDTRKTVHVHDNGNKTPTPDAVDDSHVPAAVRGMDGPPKSVTEINKEHHRQVSLPGEGRTQDRVQVDKKELMGAMVGKRTGDNSTPVPTETSTPRGTSGDKAPRKKLTPGDSVDNLTGGSTGTGGTPGPRPGRNEGGASTESDSSSSTEGGGEPPRR